MKRTVLAGKKSSEKDTSTRRRSVPAQQSASFAVCVKNDGYQASLERYKIYRVLRDPSTAAEGDMRVIDESGEDYLYPAAWFVSIQPPAKVKAALLAGDETP